MDEQRPPTRAWLRLPCRAVRVRATLDGGADGDLLRETLLRLLCGRRFTLNELDEILGGLGSDTVEAALERLAIDFLVARPATPAGAWSSVAGTLSMKQPQIRGGWVVISPHNGQPVPAVWLGSEPPRVQPEGGFTITPTPTPDLPPGNDRSIQRLLTTLCTSKAPLGVHDGECARIRPSTTDRDVPKVRALQVDDYYKRRWRKAVAWIPVSFLPRMSGDATFVVHGPQLEPADPVVGNVNDGLFEWIRTDYPAAWEALSAHARRFGDDSSIIRRLVGIETEDELVRMIDRHFTDRARKHDLPARRGEHVNVEQQVRLAHRWLILSRRDPRYHQQARDAFGHAIELLCQVLARFERGWLRPYVERLVAEDTNRRHSKDLSRRLEERLLLFGLQGRLSESEKFLLRASPKDVLREMNAGKLGAGAALTVWLFPLAVADDLEAAEFARQIGAMLRREPSLFEMLDTLVRIRNDVFHQARDSRLPPFVQQPDRVDEYLMRAWSAVLHGDRHIAASASLALNGQEDTVAGRVP